MVIVKNKFVYKGFKIKYKVHMDKRYLLGTDTYDLYLNYQIGFFGNSEHVTLDTAWSAKTDSVERFFESWKNKSKEQINEIALRHIKEAIDKEIQTEEQYESLISKLKK